MRLSARQMLSIVIAGLLCLLVWGIKSVIEVLPDAEPFGYGASGIGIVAGACVMGLLVVLLLGLLIAWQHTGRPAGVELPAGRTQPSLGKSWLLLVTCSWAGTFWIIIGIARVWSGIDILLGIGILLLAVGATYHIIRKQRPPR